MKLEIERSYEYRPSRLAIMSGILIALCAAQPGLAQQSAPLKPSPTAIAAAVPPAATHTASGPAAQAAAQEEAEEKTPSASGKTGDVGIKVHGHWKFVVHGPDGKLVSTREFENSLVTPNGGDVLLANLLAGQAVAADFAIVLCPTTAQIGITGICPATNFDPVAVLVPSPKGSIATELGSQGECGGGCFPGLTKQVMGGVTPGAVVPVSLVLSGNYTASGNASISTVETVTGYCTLYNVVAGFVNISPQTCDTLTASNPTSGNAALVFDLFTATNLSAPQVLTAGQILTVTVTISFS